MKKFLNIFLIGSIWGLLEATLGGLFHAAHFPFTGMIMAPIGFAILFAGQRNGLKHSNLFLVSAIAASFKFIDVILFSMPITHIRIVNPAFAIITQAMAVGVCGSFSTMVGAGFSPRLNAQAKACDYLTFVGSINLLSCALFNLFSYSVYGVGQSFIYAAASVMVSTFITIIFLRLAVVGAGFSPREISAG